MAAADSLSAIHRDADKWKIYIKCTDCVDIYKNNVGHVSVQVADGKKKKKKKRGGSRNLALWKPQLGISRPRATEKQ